MDIDIDKGPVIAAFIAALIGVLRYFYISSKKREDKTLTKILNRLDSDKEREVVFREEWGSVKKELEIFSSSAKIVRHASEEIIILKRNLETAFKKIDEVRATSHELHQSIAIVQSLRDSIECVELSQEENFSLVLGRLYVLKKAIEGLGGTIQNADWIEPMKQNEQGE